MADGAEGASIGTAKTRDGKRAKKLEEGLDLPSICKHDDSLGTSLPSCWFLLDGCCLV
jgi:hypothetical protein